MSRKCYYIYDKEVGKVLIAGCWAVAISADMDKCTCRNKIHNDESEKIKKIKQELSEIEKENARLWRMLKRVKGFR